MPADIELLLGLLAATEPAGVAWEDFEGEHGRALREWQELGFLDRVPGAHPSPSCPHCEDGVPYALGGRLLCNTCRSAVEPGELLLWRFDPAAFLRWLAGGLGLRGGVRRVDAALWQLGTGESGGTVFEGFFVRGETLSARGRERAAAYRATVVFYGLDRPRNPEGIPGCACVSLLGVLRHGDSFAAVAPPSLFAASAAVRFDAGSGSLWAGNAVLGEVPFGGKEWAFLDCLWHHVDRYVPYADIKRAVVRQAGSADTTEEATFCHALKRRLKKRIPGIDRLLVTTNKGDGYRLRAQAEP